MKKLLFFWFCLVSLNVAARVRTGEPRYHVLQSRCIDSVEYSQILVEFDGKQRICVVGSDCACILDAASAIFLFGYTEFPYVKPKDLPIIYSILNSFDH